MSISSRQVTCLSPSTPPANVRQSHLLTGALTSTYNQLWSTALPLLKSHLLFRPQAPNNKHLLFPGEIMAWKDRTSPISGKVEHLSCFLGGLFALSSRTFASSTNATEDLELGRKLTEGCVWAYETTASGVMPDTVTFQPCSDRDKECKYHDGKLAKWKSSDDNDNVEIDLPKGFSSVQRPEYLLRPEAIESVFYMYRITGDEVWREKGWRMFEAVRRASRAKYGHASVKNTLIDATAPLSEGESDVQKRKEGNQMDKMESFWLSETLKYFFLLFADPRVVSLDEWVFNTEGHPFRLVDEYRGDLI